MKSKRFDYIFVGVVIGLIISGILILAIVSAPFSLPKFNTTYYFLIHQIVCGLIPGLALAIIFFKIPLDFLKKIALILFILNLIVLTFVFLPKIGFSSGGASRWINLGKVTFQPSEFLKLTFILYLSAIIKKQSTQSSNDQSLKRKPLSKKRKKHYDFKKTLIPFLFFVGIISLILISQPDISTLGIIVFIALLIYFGGGAPIWHSIIIVLAAASGVISLIKIAPYRLSRFLVFLKPEIDPMGIGYQIKQSLIAVGSGGIRGLGIGMSAQKVTFLPHPMSDSIFAVFAEETGFVGCCILISLFLIFLWRGLRISKNSQDKFAQLVALGICSWIVLQAFISIGSLIGILPLTGIPLPFISYGGSHLVAELIGIGILLNISKF